METFISQVKYKKNIDFVLFLQSTMMQIEMHIQIKCESIKQKVQNAYTHTQTQSYFIPVRLGDLDLRSDSALHIL